MERLISHITRSRIPAIAAVALLAVALTIPGRLAQARVDGSDGRSTAAQSPDTIAFATGGGTVVVDATVVASFGLNAKRPDGTFTSGAAQGRINYDKHANITGGRHVNVPVIFMQADIIPTPGSPNGTGGTAQISGNCNAVGAECPTGTAAVLVSVSDTSDSGAQNDSFVISFCSSAATSSSLPTGCVGADGGPLRTGNIQIRASGPSAGGAGTALTAAKAPLRLP